MPLLAGVVLVVAGILLLPALYLFTLTVACVVSHTPARGSGAPTTRFVILVPAHDEELLLPRLLQSLRSVRYPAGLVEVHVVADNCTDGTAQGARALGVAVHERQDPLHPGKGHALRWLLHQVREAGLKPDAYIFLDADCLVSPNFLEAMDARLRGGQQVVQGYYTVANAFESPVATLRYLAMVLMHYVRPRGRQALGLSCGLFGTGMAFRREVLEAYDWDAYTLAEDVEYFMKLTEKGVRVYFAPEAIVASDMPAALRAARSQNLRWEKGRLQMARAYAPRFFFQGLMKKEPIKVDAALQQALPPLSIAIPGACLLLAAAPFTGSGWAMGIAGAAVGLFVGHVALGLLSARVPLRAYRAFGYAPFFVAWKLLVYAHALRPGATPWVRTVRERKPDERMRPPR